MPEYGRIEEYVRALKQEVDVPVVLFPGDAQQFTDQADALLYLSLVSGRNPEYLIGQHVRSAIQIRQSGVETIPTGYILVDGGTITSTMQVTHTEPILAKDIDTIVATAMAAEMLGMKMVYLEAGSGAACPVSSVIIRAVREAINIPIIVGGGLRSREALDSAYEAGADLCVVGNVLENHPELLETMTR